jgi:hypothetical protein
MNYFAHGIRFCDRPYFLAGTACPDWLSVADRRVRLRARRVEPFADGSPTPAAELAAGVMQHLADDQLFHQSRAFVETSGELTRLIRAVLGPEDGFRPGFLGHITTELILDGVLIEQNPEQLDAYYDAIDQLDGVQVQHAVNQMARGETLRLADLIPRFHTEQFLRDYLDSDRLLYRLNQVMRRIKLRQLPDELSAAFDTGREIVRRRMKELLPFPLTETSLSESRPASTNPNPTC